MQLPRNDSGQTVYSLIPSHGLGFDLFPVAKPADVRPVRRDRVKIQFERIVAVLKVTFKLARHHRGSAAG